MSNSCLFIGDCIALGLALLNPHCDSNAVVGRSASAIARQHLVHRYDKAVISAGSNNPADANLQSQLRSIRRRLLADHVVWVVPTDARAGRLVRLVALSFGDRVVPIGRTARDGIHPRSYRELNRVL